MIWAISWPHRTWKKALAANHHLEHSLALTMFWLVVTGTWLLFSHILGMSSSQLTNSYFSEGLKPPTSVSFEPNFQINDLYVVWPYTPWNSPDGSQYRWQCHYRYVLSIDIDWSQPQSCWLNVLVLYYFPVALVTDKVPISVLSIHIALDVWLIKATNL